MVECFKLFCATLKKIEDGCVLCTLEFDGALDLRSFLRGYRDGKLSETLTKELITEEMKQEGGPDLCVDITLLVAMETTRSGDEEEELLQAFRRLSFETPRRHFVDIAMKLGIKLDSMTQSDTMKPTFRSQLVFDALRMWRMREGKAATLSALAKHLRELDLPYLADLVLWTPMNLGDVSEERGAVGGQEAIETRRSVYPTVTVDPDIPIIDNKLLHSQLFIGAGGFGAVVKAYHTEWKQDVAIKRISSLQEYSSEQLMYSETSILKRAIQSDHVINLLGSCLEPHVSIVMPYMKNGSLASLLQRVDVPWALRWRMAHEISLGMTFLHRQIPQILHCNLTAENVLLDDEFHVKISGFGSTALMLQTGTSMPVFTPIHASPEVLENSSNEYFVLTTKVDVYSFGVLLWEIMTREKPYEGIEDVVALIYRVVTKGLRPDMTQVPKDSPEEDTVSQLMQKCWSQLPEDRPSFDDCEEHLRDVNKRSSKEDILDAIIYVKLTTTEGIGQYKKGEESPLRSMTTRSKVPKERTRVEEEEEEVLYDAYICHCAEDDFVREMVENLERPPFGPEGKGLRLFSFKRDAWPGMPIHDIVIEAIERSRHLVLVLSPEALTSQMCRIEMECAASLPPEERRPKVIPVMYKQTDIPSWLKSMVILDYVKEEKRRKGWFWVKLARAISNP
ncbi:uncharacterized protein [Branchiostoma lanceolatum]|uniref:uncharacterized protein isoform X2 n=1 Tax=Branchiostoma lanceolatum TaxID=7740 RepID=UPI003453B2C9